MGSAEKPQTTFRVHVETEAEGVSTTLAFPVTVFDPEETIYVKNPPELSERDVANVQFKPAANGVGMAMKIILTEHGKDVFQRVTLENVGRVLVVFLNSRIVYAPEIDRMVKDGVLVIPSGVSLAESEQIKKDIELMLKKRRQL